MKIHKLIIMLVFSFIMSNLQAQTIISSLTELKNRLDDSDGDFKMTPGTYYFNADNCGDGKLFSDNNILMFTGSNSTFDFTDVKFEFDTELLSIYNDWVVEFWPTGNNNVYLNLTMEDIGNNSTNNQGSEAIHLDGDENRIEGFHITTRGSKPYGYGDIFGKGGGSVISHKKHAGILIRGNDNHVKGITLLMRSYGHGIFVQGGTDTVIEGCYVEGETRTVSEVLAEEGTSSSADNVEFLTVWGYNLKELDHNYTFSLQEDGIRCYSSGTNYGDTEETNTTGTKIIDCTVVKMRSGVTIGLDKSAKHVENTKVLACETGFWVGGNSTVVNCSGDASIGPLYSEDIGRSDSTIELTLLDNYIPKIGNTPYLFFAGSNHNLTLHDGTTSFNEDITLQVGGSRQAHRWLEGSGTEPINRSASNSTFTNNTLYPVVLESNASNNDIFSCGPVTGNVSNNDVTQKTDCSYDRVCDNTPDNLQAECFDTMSGIQTEDIGNNSLAISDVNSNDWIAFNDVDLSNITSVKVIASSNTNGGNIEVRQGTIDGILLANINVSNTSGWTSYQEFSADLTNTFSGITDVYFVFTGTTGFLFNVDKLSFVADACSVASYNPTLPIGAESFCEASGVVVEEVENLRQVVSEINDGDYLRFSNVDFGYEDPYNSIRILASSVSDGGNIEVRSGSVDGELLTTVEVRNTVSSDEYKVFKSFLGENIEGIHDIFLVFSDTDDEFMRVDNISFVYDECSGISFEAYDRIEAEDFCENGGVEIYEGSYIGNVQSGDWMRFSDVNFTTTAPLSVTLSVSGFSDEGYIDVRLDNPQRGTLVANTNIYSTNGWTSWGEVSVNVSEEVTGVHDVYIYFGDAGNNMNWFQFSDEEVDEVIAPLLFNPDVTKTYYINNPSNGFRLGADGESETVYTTSLSDTGINLEWKFVERGTGNWYIERAGGGTKSRFSSDGSGSVEMNNSSLSNSLTYYEITETETKDLYFITLPDASVDYRRLQVNKVGDINLGPETWSDRWESFTFTEVTDSALSLSSLGGTEEYLVYPNPANDEITIGVAVDASINVYDINGKKILSKKVNNTQTLDISNLVSGLYYLEILTSNNKSISKLIKN